MRVVQTSSAERSIDKADSWWREHRDSKELLTEEFVEAVKMLEYAPHVGRRVVNVGLEGVRVVVLQKTEKLLYYRVLEEEDVVELLLLWGARRGAPPKLRAARRRR